MNDAVIPWRLPRLVLFLGFSLATCSWLSAATAAAPDPLDWPNWRGPEQNGVSREKGLIDEWELDGKNQLWKRADLGTISTPIVMRGKLYTLARDNPGTKQEQEKVVCLDAATGETIWENKFNVFLSDVPKERVAWSSCVGDPETGNVYAMGVCGYFQCLDGETGKPKWTKSLSEEFGLLSTYGGRTNVPIVFEDMVLISSVIIGWGDMARPTHRFIAFDKNTGEVRWFNGTKPLPEDTTYSTPVIGVIGGQAALVFGSGDGGLWAFQPRTGKPIWNYQLSRRGVNTSPVIAGDNVFCGHSEENPEDSSMGSLAAVNGLGTGDITKTGELWRIKELGIGKSSPLLVDDRLYVVDDSAGLVVLDAKTGERIGKKRSQKLGTMMRASLLYADGRIYACEANGRFWIFAPDEKEGVKIVQKSMRLPAGEEVLGSPIASHGRIYVPSTGAIYCLGVKDQKPSADPIPPAATEKPASDDPTPALVQVVPAEVLMSPGQKQQFRVKLFNARGQLLSETKPTTFTVDAGGAIARDGLFTADSAAGHTAATVTAQVGELKGMARVRIVPPLPWTFDFTDKQVPITWVGARHRHVPRDVDGEPMIVKITTIPKGTRSQSWMGQTDMHDYTISADVRGSIKDNKLPDIGLIAQRYTFDMMGESQQLQIRSWTPELEHRFAVTLPFKWEPDLWYTLKFQASNEGGAAVLRGKVWKRGEEEPAEWTIKGVDEVGNSVGSPGLFGNATNAEIFIDNVRVTPNAG